MGASFVLLFDPLHSLLLSVKVIAWVWDTTMMSNE